MLTRITNILPWLNTIRAVNVVQPFVQKQRIIEKSIGIQPHQQLQFNYDRISYASFRKGLNYRSNCSFSSTKLTKQQINKSTYAELVDKITKLYNFQQYKIPSALSLLEIHHQYKIFHPGDWVLDIGAGPNWAWTDLALKLTNKPDGSNKVISNDLLECNKENIQNTCITGNFLQEQVRTKIAMNLIDKQLNTILIDATPQFSGNKDQDAEYTLQIFVEALRFSEHYLKKGGTIVFKTVESALTLKNQKQAKFFFHEVYKYKSGNFRADSPAFFYVLRGYMMTDNFQAVNKLVKQYEKTKQRSAKIEIIEKYKKKYQWDPVQIVINSAKQKIAQLKIQGRKNKDIAVMFENDPYVKVNHILALIDKIQDKKSNPITKEKAKRELLLGEKDPSFILPETQQEFAQIFFQRLEEVDQEMKQDLKKRKQKQNRKKNPKQNPQKVRNVEDRAPLGDDEQYMKSSVVETEDKISNKFKKKGEYFQQDLYGFHPSNPSYPINQKIKKSEKQKARENQEQLEKIMKSFPEIKIAMQKNNTTFEQETRKQEQKFRKYLFSNSNQVDPESDKKQDEPDQEQEVKKFRRNQFQNEERQFDGQMLKTKSYYANKRKFNKLDKEELDFDFQKTEKKLDKINAQHNIELGQEEFDRGAKVQYLKSKPKKVDRQRNQKISRRRQGSYFKAKKVDQDLD